MESDLPSTLDPATIYAQVNDADNPTEIEVLYIAGIEFAGGGVPAGTPSITKPSGTTINLGTNDGSGVSKTVEVRANIHITGDLTVALAANSDLSFDTSNLPSGVTYNSGAGTLTIAQATAMTGVNITIVYSGSGAADIQGGLIITGGGAAAKSWDVIVTDAFTEVDLSQLSSIKYWTGSSDMSYGADEQRSVILDATNIDSIKIASQSNKKAFCVLCKSVPVTSTRNISYSSIVCAGETGRREIAADSVEVISIPSDCVCVVIGMRSSGDVDNYAPQKVWEK